MDKSNPTNAFLTEAKLLLNLAVPIFLAQLAMTGLGLIDTLMSGRVGVDDLAAIGLGSSIMLPVFIFNTGVLLAITPLVAKAHGADQDERMRQFVVQGIWISIPLGIFALILLLQSDLLLQYLQLSDKVFLLTHDYLIYIAFGMPAMALYQVFRFFWEGMGTTLPTMWLSFIALLVNIPLNALFIYGWQDSIPAYGAAGCGIASAIVMWLMLFFGILYAYRSKITAFHIRRLNWKLPAWNAGISEILHLGIPNALALLFEISLFTFIVLFIAVLGTDAIAAHQIAISFTSVAFMLPLSLGMALTVRIGKEYGRMNIEQLLLTLKVGFGFALLIGSFLSMTSILFRDEIITVYTSDYSVAAMASSLFILAAMYQLSDAIQVASAGALRGFHDTKVTMVVNFISYWMIGLGLGYVLAFQGIFSQPMGVAGFWLGIVIGLSLAAILLGWRLHWRYRQVLSEAIVQ
ncbi:MULTISPECIES: MATE family efflux transporter [Thiomicrorhabdus]|uniref:Multidrug-efflux transporter n=1 Tax=Thiomicrorhabdus heinhorstiae TaxID=2748010 RepID=A0ABS0BSS4_9GAMM|nr:MULTISPECIES: MATE family efflux transporter [Thiomicrorhabdus]MBF6056893.1 MATE family efflux transporter [Thiomicrorhabdus heinhorstiae]